MSDYLDGDLTAAVAAGVERHARWCPNCGRMLRNLRRTVAGLGALRHVPVSGEESPSGG